MDLCSRCGEEIDENGEYDSEVYDYIDKLCSVCLHDIQCDEDYEEYPVSTMDLYQEYVNYIGGGCD